jgi:hypothetical protein
MASDALPTAAEGVEPSPSRAVAHSTPLPTGAIESQRAPSRKPDDFRVGEPDNVGETVLRIYNINPFYIVYSTRRAIHVDIDDTNPDKSAEMVHKHQQIALELSRVYSILPRLIDSTEPINRQIARAITLNFEGLTADAKVMLADAEQRVRRLQVIWGRLQYALSSMIATLSAVSIAILSRFPTHNGQAWVSPQWTLYWQIAACGAMGGFLSVAIGFRDLKIDVDAGSWTNCFIGASRILIAIIAAMFALFVIKSGIALQALVIKGDLAPYGLYALAMIAGFSERLVPSLMENLGGQSDSPTAKHDDAGPKC